jgi:hypothetical protein
MDPVSETAVIGLVIGNVMWPSILGALFLSRIWKVSTASKARAAAPEPVPEPAAGPVAIGEKRGAA